MTDIPPQIFLDNASTTRLRKEALDAMMPYLTESYGNPSSSHKMAKGPREAVKEARKKIADCLNASSSEIFFTSGGTESDNWALKSGAVSNPEKGRHVIVTAIEHHAIIESAKWMERNGFDVTFLPVDEFGLVDLKTLESAIREDTALVSVMTANNEIGTIEPIKEIGALCKEKGILFHTDAVQAFGHIHLDVKEMNIDMLSASGHKFGGPKGVGFLYVRKGIKLEPFMHGGAQENGERAGTTNVPGIVGMGVAAELSVAEIDEDTEYIQKLRDHCIQRISSEIEGARLNGHPTQRLPGNVNFSFSGIGAMACGIPMLMNGNGMCVSTGSACAASSTEPSHVIMAIGVPKEMGNSTIRVTISRENTVEEIDRAVDVIKESVARLRAL